MPEATHQQHSGLMTMSAFEPYAASLEFWASNTNLSQDDRSELSKEGASCPYHPVALTLRFGQSHTEQILAIWTRLAEPPNQSNGRSALKFLHEHAHKAGSPLLPPYLRSPAKASSFSRAAYLSRRPPRKRAYAARFRARLLCVTAATPLETSAYARFEAGCSFPPTPPLLRHRAAPAHQPVCSTLISPVPSYSNY